VTDTLFILAVLAAGIAISEWLAAHTWCRHLGSALLVIVLTALVANLGLIPTFTPDVAVYDVLLGTVGQLAIFWLLLRVRLRAVLRAGGPMILLFLIGAAGTMIGVAAGIRLFGGSAAASTSMRSRSSTVSSRTACCTPALPRSTAPTRCCGWRPRSPCPGS